MTLLGALARRSIENPSVPLSDPALADWLSGGRSAAGVSVNEKRALGIPAYLRAVTLLSGTMAALPLKVYKAGTRERITTRTVLDAPNPRQTPFEFWQTMLANAASWGNGYAMKFRSKGSGSMTEMWPVHPSRVAVDDVKPTKDFPDGKLFIVIDKHGQEVRLGSADMLHLPYMAPNGIEGVSPLRASREALGVAIAADDYAAKFFANGTHMSGTLETEQDMPEEKAKVYQERWQQKMAGMARAHEVAVLGNGLKYTPVGIPPDDAQLLESRKFSRDEIATMFGIPPHMLGSVEKSTSWGTGIEQQTIGFVVYTLQPWLTMIEQRVTRELLPGDPTNWYAEYALEGLLRGDSKTRAEFYRVLINAGVLMPNEARHFENLEPAEGLDVFFMPKNVDVVRPDGTRLGEGEQRLDVIGLTSALQKIYLAVQNDVISKEEAREILNRGGAELP